MDDRFNITTRPNALKTGAKFYYTGKPCKHGHYALRYTKSGVCSDCASNNSNLFYLSKLKPEALDLFGFTAVEVRVKTKMKPDVDAYALALALKREPKATYRDVVPLMAGVKGCGSGTFIYRYHIHCHDADELIQFTLKLLSLG